MQKIYELRNKETNELIAYGTSELSMRKEFSKMEEDGEDMSNVIACENFMKQSEIF